MKKAIFTLLLLAVAFLCCGQNGLSIGANQDFKLAVLGDDKGNSAFTLDLTLRLEMEGRQKKHGYMIVLAEYQYAELYSPYRKYGAGIGWSFNTLIKNVEIIPAVSYNIIDHDGGYRTFEGSGQIVYNFTKTVGVFLQSVITDRKELGKIVISNGVGFKISLQRNKL